MFYKITNYAEIKKIITHRHRFYKDCMKSSRNWCVKYGVLSIIYAK